MSSKRNLRRQACEGKVKYPTMAAAIAGGLKGLRAYKCPHCRGWHLGHPTAEVKRGLAAKRATPRPMSD